MSFPVARTTPRRPASFRSKRWLGPLACALLGPFALAHAAEIKLANAWMRPAYAGQPAHEAYVDITSDTPLKLRKVSTSAAKAVEIVILERKAEGVATPKVVKSFDIPAGKETRFALHGNVLRLKAIQRALDPAQTVPLTLEFTDAKGRKHSASTDALVRGLFPKRPPEAAAGGPGGSVPASGPATKAASTVGPTGVEPAPVTPAASMR